MDIPWWEADDCLCESQACTKPFVAFQSLFKTGFKGEAGGTCGRRAWAAGNGQQVVSLCLFGNNPEYWRGLEQILSGVRRAVVSAEKIMCEIVCARGLRPNI